MASEKQIAANRRNAKKSTGPRTEEGKAASSKNALKHGLTTAKGILPGENPEAFDILQDELYHELSPETPMEYILAERIISLSWRLKRAQLFTIVATNALATHAAYEVPISSSDLLSARVELNRDRPLTALDFGQMVIRDFANHHVLDRLLVYERRIENSLFKTMRQYDKLKEQLYSSRPAHHDCPEPDPSSPDYNRIWQDPPRARPYAECHPDQDQAPSDASLQSTNDFEKTNPIAGSSSTCPEQSRVPTIAAEQPCFLTTVNRCESAPDDFLQNEPDFSGNFGSGRAT